MNILLLACKVQGGGFPSFEEAAIQKILDSEATELIEGGL
jgi:hypothetical protein